MNTWRLRIHLLKKALFICGKNKLRSPTAEMIFSAYEGIETDSAGVNTDSEQMLSTEQILWSDIIFVMEKKYLEKILKKYSYQLKNKRIICLNIPDKYGYMQPELITLLEKKVGHFLKG